MPASIFELLMRVLLLVCIFFETKPAISMTREEAATSELSAREAFDLLMPAAAFHVGMTEVELEGLIRSRFSGWTLTERMTPIRLQKDNKSTLLIATEN